MININRNKTIEILVFLVLFSFSNVFAQDIKKEKERIIHPYWAPKTWDLRADDITTIMGFRAELTGNLNHLERPTPTVVNNAFIRGFLTKDDVMTWEVEAPYEAEYTVALLYTGSNDILSKSTFEVTSEASTIIEKANIKNWDTRPIVQRQYLKQRLKLKKGLNNISFRLVTFGKEKQKGVNAEIQANANIKPNPFAFWSIELVRPEALLAIKDRAEEMKADVQWMVDGKYGLFVHFSSGSVPFNGGPKLEEQYQKLVNAFNVDAFVEKVVEIGASWVTFTCAHGTQHWPGPSKTIDALKPGFTSERDLIRELIDGLAKHNIRLMLYYNPNSGMEDLYGNTYGNGKTPDPTGYFNFLEAHLQEVSLRYGEDLATTAGYIDDGGWKMYQLDPPWEKFAKAIKAGNPNAPIGFSQNLFPNLTPFSDLVVSDGSGRVPEILPTFLFEEGGQLEGQYPASWFYMDGWSSRTGNGKFTQKPKFSAEKYIEIFKAADKANMPITINLAMTPDVTTDHPFFNPECVEIMKQVRKAVKGY
ncbi:alpha-L-fucosidase [Formosa algae]|uniref:alpha-L-fucosidase n=1 Tax=Formosa algae TaxID=225843 RepID=UPI000CD07864|nr:alpha-L-fucosidase [Formosa algae]